jgi:hypothetical protein
MHFTPPLLRAFGIGFATAFGLAAGAYRILTLGQRRNTREIRDAALARGWHFRIRRWQGNPTAFEITGESPSGLPWIVTHGQNSDSSDRWASVLTVRFPSLAGQTDFAILPRDPIEDRNLDILASSAIRDFGSLRGSMGASAIAFVHNAHELRTGLTEFDNRYRVLTMGPAVPADVSLAARILNWPAKAMIPHSVLAWRDPFAFRVQARLPGPPPWSTVEHLLLIAFDLADQIPTPQTCLVPSGRLDRFLNFLFNS